MEDTTTCDTQLSFIKIEGTRVSSGNVTISDIRNILYGLEKTTKYFINTDYPQISKDDYDIEIRIEPGSLVAYLVGIVVTGGVSVVTAFGISYAKKAGEILADNDIGEKSSVDVLNVAMKKIKSTVKIAKHVGGMGKQNFTDARIVDKDTIYIPGESGKELLVTKQELETYSKTPKDVFKKITNVIDDDTSLYFCEQNESTTSESAVVIDSSSKSYFGSQDVDDNGVVFPEWQHGEQLTLQGALCRANTNTGTLGFAYGGHILTSYLYQMEIQNIKDSLFDKEVEIEATVIRTQQKMDAEDELKRPKLEISKITTLGDLGETTQNISLFTVN